MAMEDKLMQNPYFAKAMEFIRDTDLNSMENGKHFIDGDNLFVNIVDSETGLVDYFANLNGRLINWWYFDGKLLIVTQHGVGLYECVFRPGLAIAGFDAAPDEDALLLEPRSQREIWCRKFNSAVRAAMGLKRK